MTNTAKLSTEARTALTNVGTNRQGATIPARTPAPVEKELREAGLIWHYGLTMKGSIVRERIQNEDLDRMF